MGVGFRISDSSTNADDGHDVSAKVDEAMVALASSTFHTLRSQSLNGKADRFIYLSESDRLVKSFSHDGEQHRIWHLGSAHQAGPKPQRLESFRSFGSSLRAYHRAWRADSRR